MGSAALIAVAGARWLHGDARNLVSMRHRKFAWLGWPGAPCIYLANHFGGEWQVDRWPISLAAVIVTHIQPAGDHIRGHRLIQINVVVLSPWLTLHNGRCPGRIKTPNQQHSKK
jgi:hypothetical protein